jgi:hypothetical protein
MEERRANGRLLAIVGLGVVGCAIAFGVRAYHRKPMHGNWLGYSYIDINGKQVANVELGQFAIHLKENGTFEESGNETSGTWTQAGDTLTLKPNKFRGMTPDEHRQKYLKRDGRVNETIKRLLVSKMVTMKLTYNPSLDRLLYDEETMHYEYERSR